MPTYPFGVIALIGTFRRPAEIERLLDCLCAQTEKCDACVIVDNDGESPLREVLENYQSLHVSSGLEIVYLPNPGNPGCGAGLKAGGEFILKRFEQVKYIWVLDDDAVPEPDCLKQLLKGMSDQCAGMVTPAYHKDQTGAPILVVDPHPNLFTRKRIKQLPYKEQMSALPPYFPVPWAMGVCQLVSLKAAQTLGFHRTDLWMQGDDIEFSNRIAMTLGVIAIRDCAVGHYKIGNPGPPSESAHARSFLALLQNLAYMTFHTRHGLRCFLFPWLSSMGRFLRTFPSHPGWFVLALIASFGGFVLGRPAGVWPGPAIRSRLK